MNITEIIGFTAAGIMALALLPQVLKTIRTKSTKDIAWGWVACLVTGFSLFLVYGYLITDYPIMLMNFFSLIQILIILFLKLRYG